MTSSTKTTPAEIVVLVDSNDTVIGTAEKLKAHQEGLLHRAFSIFVYRKTDQTIEFLLQQRNSEKYHCGGLWTNTCCSHPKPNESTLLAAKRRLKEEMSLDLPLTLVGSFLYHATFENGLIEHEFDHVLLGEYQDEPFCFEPSEIQDICWMTLEDLLSDLAKTPERYTPWLKPALNIVKEELCLNF